MRAADRAWLTLAGGIILYEATCDEGELLSEQVDRWLISHPILTRAAIASVALHLANAVSPRYDILSIGFNLLRRVKP